MSEGADTPVNLPELAKRLGYSRATAWRMYRDGHITAASEVDGHPKLARFDVDKVREELRPKAKRRDQ